MAGSFNHGNAQMVCVADSHVLNRVICTGNNSLLEIFPLINLFQCHCSTYQKLLSKYTPTRKKCGDASENFDFILDNLYYIQDVGIAHCLQTCTEMAILT